MFIAVRDDDRFLLGYSNSDEYVDTDESDLMLEDNIPIWKIRGKKNVLIACRSLKYSTLRLKYNNDLFKFDICDEEIFGGFAEKLKKFLTEINAVDERGNWQNEMIIINENDAYVIGHDFTIEKIENYYVSSWLKELFIGSLIDSVDEPAEKRIVDAYKLARKMKGNSLFPIAIYDSKTGKRKIVKG